MRLDSIHLTNYRCHEDLEARFASRFNVVVGVNGSGKTSLLKGICDALSGVVINMATRFIHPLKELGDVRLRAVDSNGRLRFEPQYPVRIGASGVAFDIACTWVWIKTSQVNDAELTGHYPSLVWLSLHDGDDPTTDSKWAAVDLPLVAFYRAHRHWNQPQPDEMQAATRRNSRTDGYASWWDASLDAVALQAWVIAKCLERFQTSSETGTRFDAIDDDELALVNVALAAAVESVKGLRYDLKQKSLLVEWMPDATGTARDPTAFENLSDGQRAVIGLVADIARRMCLLNPQLGRDVTTKTPGVVLIDELDIHLHPRWQRLITTGLKTAFPALQFIVASHSPQVLGELKPEEIILLRPGGTSHPQVSYGLDSSQVLEEIMGATARSPAVENALSDLFATLERNELDAARSQLKALAETAPGIAELAGAEALLKRKEVLGR